MGQMGKKGQSFSELQNNFKRPNKCVIRITKRAELWEDKCGIKWKAGGKHLQGGRDSVREGNGTPLQYSCLENPMDGGAW